MFNLTQKSKLLCPMHQKLVKYLNIGKECQFDQRIGCSSYMGSDFIDFELVEELLSKLFQGDINNDQKQQLSIDFIRHIELFQQQINCLLDQMKKCSENKLPNYNIQINYCQILKQCSKEKMLNYKTIYKILRNQNKKLKKQLHIQLIIITL